MCISVILAKAFAIFLTFCWIISIFKNNNKYNTEKEDCAFVGKFIIFASIAGIFCIILTAMPQLKEENKEVPIIKENNEKQYVYIMKDKNGELKIIEKDNEIYKAKLEKY